MSDSIETNVKSIIAQVLFVEETSIMSDSGLGNPQEWDSFAQISIMLEIERKFARRFTPEEIANHTIVESIITLLKSSH
jgi:acyl carrier protein